jgi:hypothetical protein
LPLTSPTTQAAARPGIPAFAENHRKGLLPQGRVEIFPSGHRHINRGMDNAGNQPMESHRLA